MRKDVPYLIPYKSSTDACHWHLARATHANCGTTLLPPAMTASSPPHAACDRLEAQLSPLR
jgi:hypothetical protein